MLTRSMIVLGSLLVVLLGLAVAPAAAGCTLSIPALDFSHYDPLWMSRATLVGYATYTCTTASTNIRITFSAGQSGNPLLRTLKKNGSSTVYYQLALDATYLQTWGDGYNSSYVYTQASVAANTPVQVPIYARTLDVTSPLPSIGIHSDTISAVISWD